MNATGRLGHRPRVVRVGLGTACGTFGELLQGALPGPGEQTGEGRFLVTLPIARWSTARLELWPAPELEPAPAVTVSPGHKTKAARLAVALLQDLGCAAGGTLWLDSSIPEGKGLASSSADLVATARAVLAATDRTVAPDRLGALLAAIEPTDGVMFPGVVAFDHRRGRHLRSLGTLPALQVIAVDQGGHLDTVAFNRTAAGYGPDERGHYQRLLDRLTVAVAAGDLGQAGQISTRSAELNQTRVPHRHFEALRQICDEVGGLGLVACHSGTMIGILLDPRDGEYRTRLSAAVRLTSDLGGPARLYRTLSS